MTLSLLGLHDALRERGATELAVWLYLLAASYNDGGRERAYGMDRGVPLSILRRQLPRMLARADVRSHGWHVEGPIDEERLRAALAELQLLDLGTARDRDIGTEAGYGTFYEPHLVASIGPFIDVFGGLLGTPELPRWGP